MALVSIALEDKKNKDGKEPNSLSSWPSTLQVWEKITRMMTSLAQLIVVVALEALENIKLKVNVIVAKHVMLPQLFYKIRF